MHQLPTLPSPFTHLYQILYFLLCQEYDAQLGDWVCLGSLADDELAKRQEKKEKVAETKQNVTQQKGKNFGLGGFDKGMVRSRVVWLSAPQSHFFHFFSSFGDK